MANELYRAWPDCESQMGALAQLTLPTLPTQLATQLATHPSRPLPVRPSAKASFKPLISLPCARYELQQD